MSLTLGWSLATSPGASCSLAVGRGGGSGATSAQSRPELTPGDPLPCLHPSYCNLVLLVTPNPVLLQSTLGTFFSKLTCFIQGNYRVKIWRQALLSAVGRGRRIRTQAPQGLRRPRGREHPQLWEHPPPGQHQALAGPLHVQQCDGPMRVERLGVSRVSPGHSGAHRSAGGQG